MREADPENLPLLTLCVHCGCDAAHHEQVWNSPPPTLPSRGCGPGLLPPLLLGQSTGSVAAVVVGGSNAAWSREKAGALSERVAAASALLLQREVPEEVNEALAAAAHRAGVPVLQDAGGDDRPISDALLRLLTYICPNESELGRHTQCTPHSVHLRSVHC